MTAACFQPMPPALLAEVAMRNIERLECVGISRVQATAIVEAQQDSIAEIVQMRDDLPSRITRKDEIRNIEKWMEDLRSDAASVKWMVGVLVLFEIANFVKQFL